MLDPDWNQAKPSADETVRMCSHVQLSPVILPEQPFLAFVESIANSHVNGGAQLAAFDVGANSDFDWFASRNRLSEFAVLDNLLVQSSFKRSVPELRIPDSRPEGSGFTLGI